MAKFEFRVSTRIYGSTVSDIIEIPDEELEGKSEGERMDVINSYWQKWIWEDNIDGGWDEIEEGE